MSTTRTLAAALAIAALAAPAAQAQPADMHASVAQAAAQAQNRQDLRSPDARDAATTQAKQDLRSADAQDAAVHPRGPGHPSQPVNAPGATTVDSASTRTPAPVAGLPTWPANPQPIAQAPVAEVTGDGDGIDWTTIGLGIAGSLLAVCGLAVLASRRSRPERVRVTV
jgi:hypothetical protein